MQADLWEEPPLDQGAPVHPSLLKTTFEEYASTLEEGCELCPLH